jgi:DNA-binding CsgD family transcriptional regulator
VELTEEFADLRLELEASALCAALFVAPELGRGRKLVAARAMPVPDSIGARRMAAVAAWGWALTGGASDACVKLALSVLAGGDLIAAVLPMAGFLAIGVVALAGRDEAPPILEAFVAEARVHGSLDATAGALMWSGWTWLERGELAEAEDCLTQALDLSLLWNPREGQALLSVTGWLARVLIERGDLSGARVLLNQGPSPATGSAGDNLRLRSRIELLLAEGAGSEALPEADRYARQYEDVENPAWAPWASLKAIALSRAGRQKEASELLVEELAQARRWGAPGPVGRTLRLLGSLRRSRGLDLLQEAVEVTAPGSARLEHAKALAALGAALRRGRHPTEARDPLRRALELATHCGAAPLVALARSELLASGARPRGRDLAGVGSLTPSERRVVDLAASGRSNREIAELLYITPKTVEIHLTTSYLKLGIHSRQDLAAALATPT